MINHVVRTAYRQPNDCTPELTSGMLPESTTPTPSVRSSHSVMNCLINSVLEGIVLPANALDKLLCSSVLLAYVLATAGITS